MLEAAMLVGGVILCTMAIGVLLYLWSLFCSRFDPPWGLVVYATPIIFILWWVLTLVVYYNP